MSAALGALAPATVLLPGFSGHELPAWLDERLRGGLAGVCLFGENIRGPAQLRELTAAIRRANPAALIAIDEEGGDVTRLYYDRGSPHPGNAVLGRLDDPELTAAVARSIAAELRELGVGLNLAPAVDVNSNPDNPVIGTRSFGAHPALVARHTAAWVAAHEALGVATSAKHFPGHGDTAQDSHLALPEVHATDAQLRARELVPFRAAIAAGARTVMTSHILVPALDPDAPATFSTAILLKLLRGELGFDGVVVTDALDMAGASAEIGMQRAAVRALAAGADLLCLGPATSRWQLDTIEAAIADGVARDALPAARLADAGSRVASLAASVGPTAARPRTVPAPAQLLSRERIAASFEVRPGLRVPPGARLVVAGLAANIAVGEVPWGVSAAGAEATPIAAGDPPPHPGAPLVVVGRDNHRHAWLREFIERERAARTVVAVDMGWPSPDRAWADVATFGASRLLGEALLLWLAERGLDARASGAEA